MKNVYVVLSNSETYFTKFLRMFTKCRYNHVSFTFDIDCERLYTFARWVTWMPILAGFEIENIDRGVLKKKPLTECRVYKLEVSDEEYIQIKKRLKPFLTRRRMFHWYNFLALVYMQFNIPYYSETRFVCSTFVAYMLGDVIGFKKAFINIKPTDYLDMEMPLIYEGKLGRYIELGK